MANAYVEWWVHHWYVAVFLVLMLVRNEVNRQQSNRRWKEFKRQHPHLDLKDVD